MGWYCHHDHRCRNSISCTKLGHVHCCAVRSIHPPRKQNKESHRLCVSSFLVGFGLTFAANAAPMLVTEISYPAYRAPLTALYNSLWYSGNIMLVARSLVTFTCTNKRASSASWSSFGTGYMNSTWAWRIPSLLQGLPSVIQVFFIFWVPESPRWLISKGRDAEGLRILAYYHADGNEQDPLVQYEFEEIKTTLDLDREVQKNVGWKALIATPGNRKRMIIIVALAWFSQWSGNGLVSYYLNKVFTSIGITSHPIQLMITGYVYLSKYRIRLTHLSTVSSQCGTCSGQYLPRSWSTASAVDSCSSHRARVC